VKIIDIPFVLFPSLVGKKFVPISLDAVARQYIAEHSILPSHPNPFLDPIHCQKILDAWHASQGAFGSFGGYLEDWVK
jgi:hypothetical protein